MCDLPPNSSATIESVAGQKRKTREFWRGRAGSARAALLLARLLEVQAPLSVQTPLPPVLGVSF